MSKNLTVIAHITAKPGKEEELKKTLLGLIEPTRTQDEGCINYDLHQNTENPSHFIFHENWTNRNALETHLQKPHLQEFIGKADELLSEPPQIFTCEMISEPQ